ncbi:MAG: DUF3108 domain-containing protein [Desulfobacteria bacterium]|nr:DUF3108 domain-containing protein [Deltaproteobacteria bacterium]
MRIGKGISSLLLLAFLLAAAGCHRYERGVPPTPPPGPEERLPDNIATSAGKEWLAPAVKTVEPEDAVPPSLDNTAGDGHGRPSVEAGMEVPAPVASTDGQGRPSVEAGMEATAPVASTAPAARSVSPPAGAGTSHANARRPALKAKPAAVPHAVPTAPPKDTRGASLPEWAKSPEELVYRVDFIGITMGYARFRYEGKVSIAGKPAFHLNVRAWTSGVLSYIFPINETIDYYLDTETLAPIRQEFTNREREKDDVALYDQETGRITYRYRQSGKIRKRVDTVPSVYDPVSVAYYFRWKDLGAENRPRNMYGGRKIYQISSRILGNERIRTEHGEVDTIAVLPLIRRDGRPDDKGDLKIWFSNDARRVPVRLYAKFHKIKDWTLVGEWIPPTVKTGG